jgi:AraC family transcriptional activator of tynA and feaB
VLHSRQWTTAQAGTSDLVDYWRKAICEAIFELEFDAPAGALDATLRQYQLGALRLSNVSVGSTHEVIRSREAIARNNRPHFNLNYVRRGEWTVDHCGHEIELHPGELILLDNRQPYSVRSNGADHIAVHLPVEWLRCWIPNPEAAVAKPIRLGTPWRAALAASLDDATLLPDAAPGSEDLCAEQIAGALALALGPTRTRNTTHTRLIFLRVQGAMRRSFHDHELDAKAIATTLGISARYLHKILAREETTYGRELIRIRLERAMAMLRDARFNELSIAEIGWRCGFSDPSHFSKRFREACEQTPGSFRSAVQYDRLPGRALSS